MSFRVSAHVRFRRIDDEAVLLDARSDAYFGLNPSGVTVWEALSAGAGPKGAEEALVLRYGVSGRSGRSRRRGAH